MAVLVVLQGTDMILVGITVSATIGTGVIVAESATLHT